jgi:hypothetical protein
VRDSTRDVLGLQVANESAQNVLAGSEHHLVENDTLERISSKLIIGQLVLTLKAERWPLAGRSSPSGPAENCAMVAAR